MNNWYCLDSKGELWFLGQFSSYDEADESAEKQGYQAIWLIDHKTAKQWLKTLNELEPCI